MALPSPRSTSQKVRKFITVSKLRHMWLFCPNSGNTVMIKGSFGNSKNSPSKMEDNTENRPARDNKGR